MAPELAPMLTLIYQAFFTVNLILNTTYMQSLLLKSL